MGGGAIECVYEHGGLGRWKVDASCVCSTWEQVGKFEGVGDTAY